MEAYTTAAETASDVLELDNALQNTDLSGIAMIVLCDDSAFTALNINNFVWVTFTRSNPAADIYGIGSATHDKHWGCEGPIIIDARKKPHHAPELIKDPVIEANTTRILEGLKRQEQ